MEILLPKMKILLARGLRLWQIPCVEENQTMQNQFSSRTLYTLGAALTAIILTTTNLHAGLFNIPSEPADWNGMYVAFNGGGVWNNYQSSDYTTRVDLTGQFNELPPPTAFTSVNTGFFNAPGHSSNDSSGIFGVDIGYNKQWGMFVAGFGFGFSGNHTMDSAQFRDFQTNTLFFPGTNQPPTPVDTDFHSWRQEETNWSGYAGAQLGVAWHRFLFYGMGGSAFTELDVRELDRATTSFTNVGPVPFTTDKSLTATNNILAGWYAGGGVQFAVTNVVTAGLEFRHSDYGDRTYKFHEHQEIFPGATNFSTDSNSVIFKVTILLNNLGQKKAPEPGLSKK
jgi:outer membrane immunogenic protein